MSPRRSEELLTKGKWVSTDFKCVFSKTSIKPYKVSDDYKYSPRNSHKFREVHKDKWIVNRDKVGG